MMDVRYARVWGIVVGLLFILVSSIAWSAKLKITIDPKTRKPVVKSDVPVVARSVSPTGWVMLTLSTGERVGYFVDPAGNVSVQVFAGAVEVAAGNTVARMEAGEAATIKVNPATKTVQVTARKGVIDVASQGKRIKIKVGQQTTVSSGAPPSPPAPAPAMAMRVPPPVPHVPAAPPPAPAPTPAPPKYQVNPYVPPPPPVITQGAEFHGQAPASPAE